MVGVLIQLWINRKTADLTAEAAAAAAGSGSNKGGPRAVEKPGAQKGPKDKNSKRRQGRRGGAEAEGF